MEGTLLALKRPILLPTPTSRDSVVVIVAVCLPDDISKSLRVVCSASGKGLGGRGGGYVSSSRPFWVGERDRGSSVFVVALLQSGDRRLLVHDGAGKAFSRF